MKPLLPDRYPTKDFFVADIFDASPKDDMASMEHPMFSLATQPDLVQRHYEHNGNSLTITPSILGLATIWDKDILIYCISQLMEGINRGRQSSPVIRITAHDLLVSTNRPKGGSDYARLMASFERLAGTRIKTNIVTNNEIITEGFGFIDRWKIVERSADDDRMVAVEVKLSDWLYNAVLGSELLTINRDYFRLRGGLERRLYELARKHCGSQKNWTVGIPLLYKKSGAKCVEKVFRSRVKKIALNDVAESLLPDYKIRYYPEKDQVTFFNRKGSKAAKAEFDIEIKKMLQPERKKKRKRSTSKQKELSL